MYSICIMYLMYRKVIYYRVEPTPSGNRIFKVSNRVRRWSRDYFQLSRVKLAPPRINKEEENKSEFVAYEPHKGVAFWIILDIFCFENLGQVWDQFSERYLKYIYLYTICWRRMFAKGLLRVQITIINKIIFLSYPSQY